METVEDESAGECLSLFTRESEDEFIIARSSILLYRGFAG